MTMLTFLFFSLETSFLNSIDNLPFSSSILTELIRWRMQYSDIFEKTRLKSHFLLNSVYQLSKSVAQVAKIGEISVEGILRSEACNKTWGEEAWKLLIVS